MIRVLDPTTAVVRPDQEIGDTVYISDRILVRADQLWAPDARVSDVLKRLGLGLRPPERAASTATIARFRADRSGARTSELESQQVVGLELVVVDQAGAPAPDAWTVLQQIRSSGSRGRGGLRARPRACSPPAVAATAPASARAAATSPASARAAATSPASGMGPDEFGVPGYGGKAPVAVVMADPSKSAPRLKRPPVVVMPDTGIGDHPWFPDEAIVGHQRRAAGIARGQDRRRSRRRPRLGGHLAAHRRVRPARRPRHLHRRPRPPDRARRRGCSRTRS